MLGRFIVRGKVFIADEHHFDVFQKDFFAGVARIISAAEFISAMRKSGVRTISPSFMFSVMPRSICTMWRMVFRRFVAFSSAWIFARILTL